MITIRKARKEDFEEYFKLEREYHIDIDRMAIVDEQIAYPIKCKFYKKFLIRIRPGKKLFLVLDDGKHLQGFFMGVIEIRKQDAYRFKVSKIGYVGNVFIRKRFRGKGYFSIFIKEFFNYLKKNNVKYCALHADIPNKTAQVAYKRFGFKPTEYKMVMRLK